MKKTAVLAMCLSCLCVGTHAAEIPFKSAAVEVPDLLTEDITLRPVQSASPRPPKPLKPAKVLVDPDEIPYALARPAEMKPLKPAVPREPVSQQVPQVPGKAAPAVKPLPEAEVPQSLPAPQAPAAVKIPELGRELAVAAPANQKPMRGVALKAGTELSAPGTIKTDSPSVPRFQPIGLPLDPGNETVPASGDRWFSGETKAIRWPVVLPAGSRVRITVRPAATNDSPTVIAQAAEADKQGMWTIPLELGGPANGSPWKYVFTVESSGGVVASSEFYLQKPSVRIKFPPMGPGNQPVVLSRKNDYLLTWDNKGDVSRHVKITFYSYADGSKTTWYARNSGSVNWPKVKGAFDGLNRVDIETVGSEKALSDRQFFYVVP